MRANFQNAPSNRPGGTRTPNPRFWRPVLYQLSYGPLFSNGQGRNRTTDTAIFSRVLYQLSYLADTNTNWPAWPTKKPPEACRLRTVYREERARST